MPCVRAGRFGRRDRGGARPKNMVGVASSDFACWVKQDPVAGRPTATTAPCHEPRPGPFPPLHLGQGAAHSVWPILKEVLEAHRGGEIMTKPIAGSPGNFGGWPGVSVAGSTRS